MFRGYIDESHHNYKLFALSCLIAKGKDWFGMERMWKEHLAAKNKQLKKAGRKLISRYHATDCNGRRNDFEGWEEDERNEFVFGLFNIFKRVPVHAVGYDIDLDRLCRVFPEWSKDRLEAAYQVLVPFIMHTIGEDFRNLGGGVPAKVTLFHDRTASDGKYDLVILSAFNREKTDIDFPYASYFTTIAPLGWEDCIALQSADLVAFEVFKDAEVRAKRKDQRKSLKALIDLEAFGIHTKSVKADDLWKMRKLMEREKAKYFLVS